MVVPVCTLHSSEKLRLDDDVASRASHQTVARTLQVWPQSWLVGGNLHQIFILEGINLYCEVARKAFVWNRDLCTRQFVSTAAALAGAWLRTLILT